MSSGGSTAGGSSTPLNLWYVNPLPSTPDWGRSGQLFEDAATDGGYEATLVGPDQIDIPAMVSEIEQAIADDADGIITCPLDPAAFADVIGTAHDKGIGVASIGCVDDDADFSVGTGNDEYGRLSADLIAEATGGEANVAIIGTDQTTPNQVAQVEGFRAQVADKYPNIKEVTWESDNSDAGVAAQKIGALLAAYPDLDYLWIIEGAAPGAVPAAFQEAGKEPGDIGVLAIDAQDSTLQAIKDGWITTTLNQCWFDASPQVAQLLVELAGGQQPASTFYSVPVDAVSAEDLPYTGCDPAAVAAVFESTVSATASST
jgi:ribose transport system substrate-binding protein